MKLVNAPLIALIMLATTSTVALSADITTRTWVVHNPRIVNLERFCLAQDGQTWPLFYDRSLTPFVIPKGYSFVVADIVALPFCIGAPDPDVRWHFILEGPLARRFVVQFRGDSTTHYALSGGIAYTSNNVPAIRMVRGDGLSPGSVDVQILGYFVKGEAIPPAGSRF